MKKALSFLLAVLTLLSFSGWGKAKVIATDVSLEEIRDELIRETGIADPIILNAEYLGVFYGVDSADLQEFAAYMVTQDIFSHECVMLRAVDEDAAKRLKALLTDHLEYVRDQSRTYDPQSYAIAKKSQVREDGLYISLFVSDQQDTMLKLYKAHLNKYAPEDVPVYATPEPTPAPTSTPEPTAAVVATPEPTPIPFGLVPEGDRAEDSWFDDVIFIGNSVAKNLETYVLKRRMSDWPECMGKAIFFTAGSFTYYDSATHHGVFPTLAGARYFLEDVVPVSGAKKVFISMGHGDMIFDQRPIDETIGYVSQTIEMIMEKSPDVQIYILAMSPRHKIFNREGNPINNAYVRDFDAALLQCAIDHDCYFIDSYEALSDENGDLPEEFSSETYDGGIHLTDAGCEAWLNYLYTHTAG